jgi:transposase
VLIGGILSVIPPRTNRRVAEDPGNRRYRDRNRVERMLGKLKQQRPIATRYYKTVIFLESFLNVCSHLLMAKVFLQHELI